MKKTIYKLLNLIVIATIMFSCKKTEQTSGINEAPTITNFSPLKDTTGGILTIVGSNFSKTITDNEVKFNNVTALNLSATNTTLKVKVPNGLPSISTITVKTSGQTATSSTTFKLATPLEMLLVGKWYYKSSTLSDTEYVYNNNNQIQMLPWPFMAGTNPQTNYDSSFNFIIFKDNGISTNSRYAWGGGQSGIIYRDTVSYTQSNNNIYLSFGAGLNNYAVPSFSYSAYQDTIIVNSITANSLIMFRRFHQKHYGNSNNSMNKKLALDTLIKY